MKISVRYVLLFCGALVAGVYLHEIGHAVVGWISGVAMIPRLRRNTPFNLNYRGTRKSGLPSAELSERQWRRWQRHFTFGASRVRRVRQYCSEHFFRSGFIPVAFCSRDEAMTKWNGRLRRLHSVCGLQVTR